MSGISGYAACIVTAAAAAKIAVDIIGHREAAAEAAGYAS
jgi:hypothetical protein